MNKIILKKTKYLFCFLTLVNFGVLNAQTYSLSDNVNSFTSHNYFPNEGAIGNISLDFCTDHNSEYSVNVCEVLEIPTDDDFIDTTIKKCGKHMKG